MKVGIIDADLIFRKKHRFPNLACMKMSSYYKSQGHDVTLKLDYDNLDDYDLITISKVFMDTEIPFEPLDKTNKTEDKIAAFYANNPILSRSNVMYGGTGFYYDKSPKLDNNIEHIMPDYHLYDHFVEQAIGKGVKPKDLQYYTKFSIGFTTRGCIRQCKFCVNRNYNRCNLHSQVTEFLDPGRPYICCLDDNVFASPKWREVFEGLIATGKRFQFKQGLDERLLTDEKCEWLFNKSKTIGDIIFAFDNYKDRDLIISKLQMIRRHTNKQIRFYCFCGFNHESPGHYDQSFYRRDIKELLERIKILMEYQCLPYIMRYKDYIDNPYSGFYVHITRWVNQPSLFKKKSFREFVETDAALYKTESSSLRTLRQIEKDFPDIAKRYFDLHFYDYKL